MFLVLLLYAIWSIMLFVSKAVLINCSYPFFIGGVRSLCSGFLLFIVSWLLQGKNFAFSDLSKKEWIRLGSCSILLYSIAMPGFCIGMKNVNPVVVSFIYASAPFITATLMFFLYGKKLSKSKLLGLLLGTTGLLPIVLIGENAGTNSSSLYGIFTNFSAMFLYAYAWILLKDVVGHRQNVSLFLNSLSMMFGGLITIVSSLMFVVPGDAVACLCGDTFWRAVVFFILTAVGYGMYSFLLVRYSPTFLSFAGFLDPLFGTILGVLFFDHSFKMVFLYSFIILFVGLYIFYREELQISRMKK